MNKSPHPETIKVAGFRDPDAKELGLRVTIIPSISAEEEARLTRRNYRRTVLDKARIFGVSGITNAEFLRKTVTDQFLILKTFIPDGWRPAAIEPWYEDAKIDERKEVVKG